MENPSELRGLARVKAAFERQIKARQAAAQRTPPPQPAVAPVPPPTLVRGVQPVYRAI